MSNKIHTPGPWEWFETNRGPYLATPHSGHLLVMDFVRNGTHGAQPRFATWDGESRGRMGGIMRNASDLELATHPDALLMKAAPDLLEACESALAHITCDDDGGPDNLNMCWCTSTGAGEVVNGKLTGDLLECEACKLRRAISKAKGGAT